VKISDGVMALTSAQVDRMSFDCVAGVSFKRRKVDYAAHCFSTHYFLHGLNVLC